MSRYLATTDLEPYQEYNMLKSHYGDHRRYGRAEPLGTPPFHGDRTSEMAAEGALSTLAAFGVGWYQGRNNGMPELLGFGFDWWGAGLFWLAGLFGGEYLGSYDRWAFSIGTGLANAAAVNAGNRLGCQQRAASGLGACGAPQPANNGVDPRLGPFPASTPTPAMGGGATKGWDYRTVVVPRAV